jgi:hypothetical protein
MPYLKRLVYLIARCLFPVVFPIFSLKFLLPEVFAAYNMFFFAGIIVSMHPLASKYSTHVVFGVLPYPKDASISLPALSVLRSSLIEMILQQVNLSLTPLFGHPCCFELLRFPGGVTVIPAVSGFTWANTDPLFDFVLNNSIYQILGNLTELKDQLKLGLNLRSYEVLMVLFLLLRLQWHI